MGPQAVVVAPQAEPPRYGIVAAAADVTEADGRWENGLAYAPEGCGVGGVFDPCDAGTFTLQAADNPDQVAFQPFGVWAGDRCSGFEFRSRDFQGRARRQLLACESKQIAAELWSGAQATASGWPNAFLASEASNVVTSGEAPVSDGIACLEQGLADCGCGSTGMIHVPRGLMTFIHEAGLLVADGARWVTVNGTIVVADAGYDGSGPYGPAVDGHVWGYATGRVSLRRGTIQIFPDSFAEAVDRSVNTVEWRAERMAAATFDPCCHLAAEFDVSVCASPGGS